MGGRVNKTVSWLLARFLRLKVLKTKVRKAEKTVRKAEKDKRRKEEETLHWCAFGFWLFVPWLLLSFVLPSLVSPFVLPCCCASPGRRAAVKGQRLALQKKRGTENKAEKERRGERGSKHEKERGKERNLYLNDGALNLAVVNSALLASRRVLSLLCRPAGAGEKRGCP